MKLLIVPRNDDGSYDLFEKLPNGKLDFLSNHDSLKEARLEKDDLESKPSQMETLKFFRDLKQQIKNS